MSICRHYKKGNCWRGSRCGFLHPKELRKHQHLKPSSCSFTITSPKPVEKDPNLRTLGYIQLGCLAFRATGQCAQGRQCAYIHEPHGTFSKGFSTVLYEN